jgi:hypothetical protein
MVDKFKKIFSLLIVLYLIFTVAQVTSYNIVNLRFQDDSKKLTELNIWINKNQTEYDNILKEEVKEEVKTFKNLAQDTAKKTLDEKFRYVEVKKLSKDIDNFKVWNKWRTDFLIFNWTSLFLFLLYRFIRRR